MNWNRLQYDQATQNLNRRNSSKDPLGFTLLETMIAMTILVSALILLSQSWSSAFARIKKIQNSFEAAALLERKMLEIEMDYKGVPLDSIPDDKTGDFGTDFPEYTWKLKSRKLEFPDLSGILIGQEGGADEMFINLIKQMTDFLSKSIKEVSITLIYTPQGRKKSIEYSLATYFIDQNSDIPMGGMPQQGGNPSASPTPKQTPP